MGRGRTKRNQAEVNVPRSAGGKCGGVKRGLCVRGRVTKHGKCPKNGNRILLQELPSWM